MVGRRAVPERPDRKVLPVALAPVALVGSPDAIGLIGWVAGIFMTIAVLGTLYLAFVSLREDRHGPVGVGDEAGDDPAPGDDGMGPDHPERERDE